MTQTPTATVEATPTFTATAEPDCPPTGLTIRLENPNCVLDIEGSVNDTIPIELVLYNVTDGISGFILEVSASDPDIVEFVDVQHPQYMPPGFPSIFEIFDDSQEARVEFHVVDLNDILEGSFDEATLATISAKLESPGTTSLTITVHSIQKATVPFEELLPILTEVESNLTAN